MKKLLLILVVVLLVTVVTACGGAQDTGTDTAEAEVDLSSLPQDIDVKTTNDLKDHEDVFLLDVREQYEYDEKHIPGINLIPMSEIESRIDEIPTDKTVIVTCNSGNRSNQITQALRQNGYGNVHNMLGGIVAWQNAGLPVE